MPNHTTISKPRNWSPYECTQLARWGKPNLQLPATDTTPVELLTGKVEFYNQVFEIQPGVMIPRVETEQLVELVVPDLRTRLKNQGEVRVAEVGVGCGVISISLAVAVNSPRLVIAATDINQQAVIQAKHNWSRLGDKTQSLLTLTQQAGVPTGQFEVIVANLPYIPSARISQLDPSVTDHEPVTALDGGVDGLVVIRQVLSQARHQLVPNGCVWLEIDNTHTLRQFQEPGWQAEMFQDYQGLNRFVRLTHRLD